MTTAPHWIATGAHIVVHTSIYIMGIAALTLSIGVLLLEIPFSSGPHIPNPHYQPQDNPHSQPAPKLQLTDRIVLRIYPKDRERLHQTLEQEAMLHGGYTIDNKHIHITTVAVPEAYIPQLKPLLDDSRSGEIGKGYRQWAAAIQKRTNTPTTAPADTSVTLKTLLPTSAHPVTMPLIIGSLSAFVAALVTAMVTCAVRWSVKY